MHTQAMASGGSFQALDEPKRELGQEAGRALASDSATHRHVTVVSRCHLFLGSHLGYSHLKSLLRQRERGTWKGP